MGKFTQKIETRPALRWTRRIIHRHKQVAVCANEFCTQLNCCTSSPVQRFSHRFHRRCLRRRTQILCRHDCAGGAFTQLRNPSSGHLMRPAFKEKTARPDREIRRAASLSSCGL
jgi:hypothetical protein